MKKMRYLVLCALTVLAMFALTACGTELEAKDYVTVTFEGFDGYGTATAELNTNKLIKEIMGEDNYKDSSYSNKKEKKELEDIANEKIEIKLKKTENLKNGDMLDVELDISEKNAEKLGVTFANTKFEVKVSGLEKAKEIDVFGEEYFSYTVNGTSPCLDVSLENKCYEFDYPISSVSFETETEKGLKKGQTFTVTATYDEEEMKKAGYKVVSTSKDFTVTCEEEYVTAASQISKTDSEKLQRLALKKLKEEESYRNVKKTSWELVGNYVLFDDAETSYYYYENRIYYVFKGKLIPKNKEYKAKTVYTAVYFTSPIIDANGNLKDISESSVHLLSAPWGEGYQTDNWSTFNCFLTEEDLFAEAVTDQYSFDYHEVTGSLQDFSPAAPAVSYVATGSAVTAEATE